MFEIPKYAASKRMGNEDLSQNLCNKSSLIYNHTICVEAEIDLTDDMLCEQKMMVSLNFLPQYQERNTSDKSSCGSVFRFQGGAQGKSECSTGCVPLTLAVHLWCNIYCSCGQCQIWMQADHDYRRQLAVSIIHASVGHQWNLSVCNLIQFKFYIMCIISLIVCCFLLVFFSAVS